MSGLPEEYRALARDIAKGSIVTQATARLIEQILEVAHEHYADKSRAKDEALKEAIEALAPFADEAEGYEPFEDDDEQEAWDLHVTLGDLRRARAALAKIKEAING